MKSFIKLIKSIFQTNSDMTVTRFCNDPIVIEDLGRHIEHKEAFFNLYVHCLCESSDSFPVYLAKMIRHCRLHMFSLPVDEQQSFFDFCLTHKVDISLESLEEANKREMEVTNELGLHFNKG